MLEEFKNPKTRQTEYIISGVVSAIYFNELKTKKDYGRDGKSWIPTHAVNIVVDGDKVGLGLTDKEVVRIKDVDENYHDLVRGIEITVPVTVGEYNGKPQYSGFASGITVVGTDGIQQASQAASEGFKQPYTAAKRDNSGMSTGHGINVAMNVLGSVDDSNAIIEQAKKAHDLTNKLKAEYAEKNPTMSEYDVGAMVGQSVLSASHYVEDVSDIEAIARQTLDVVVPQVSEYVKGSAKAVEAVPKKTVVKKAVKKTTKKEATPDRVNDDEIPDSAYADADNDMSDSDVPF